MKMKKLIFIVPLASFLAASTFAQNVSDENDFSADNAADNASIERMWEEIGQQGMKALQEAGKFFKDAGVGIGSTVKEGVKTVVSPEKCYGEWIYKDEDSKTVLSCNPDGTMSIEQKKGFETQYWKGVYTVTLNTITFAVKETGKKSFFSSKSEAADENWFLLYTISEDNSSMKIICPKIPVSKDGTKSSGGILFTKSK